MSFGTLLVANRGEIAVRVLRAARDAGLRTVAVYSDADRDAPHVRVADTAVRLGPPPAADSYLSIPALIDAASRSGADAVHPGYGFLSERAEFASACREAGLVFVGPSPEVIELMGRKDEARRIAAAAGVPMLPAVEGADDAALMTAARVEIGFPLLVKAVSGGGGKGMRIVREDAALPAALASARREAKAAFGDDTMLIERYVEHGRHIEVQVLADSHGNVLHLYDRDCSVQRRHQKVVEEAPAPTISTAVRDTVTSAAVRLASQVGYVNAGTVEFLVQGEEAYFLEMNTRLQVEHPVTELVTGVDLVAEQLRIAQGEALAFTQEQVTVTGHAIEARVYAEDPGAQFLPQAGVARTVRWSPRARVDEALVGGQEVGTWYDPMLAKVISHAPTREAARQRLVEAIDDSAIIGLTTNLGFLRRLLAGREFTAARIDTAWLDRADTPFPVDLPYLPLVVAAWLLADDGDPPHPFRARDGWRDGGPAAPIVRTLTVGEVRRIVRVDRSAHEVRLEGGRPPGAGRPGSAEHAGGDGHRVATVHPMLALPGRARLEIDGVVHEVTHELDEFEAGSAVVCLHGQNHTIRPASSLAAEHAAPTEDVVRAPMPGLVLSVVVQAGQTVVKGEHLGVLEAMKMEVTLTAPHDGTVGTVAVASGDQVAAGQELFSVTSDSHDSETGGAATVATGAPAP
ncbi:ATP-grasp domain-containing protein [Occultella glacieicola]|uniref:ATP-grasp domain-containing protein n=1 Tax=Occultella glacieicola TaxID=2518684 RepID=A0ABY2EA87_9MICO|nr:biotin carboxylase N-terminal domain-containing protein [Occultella glacieicola]TDE98860.1 ATP-grasp domain-containing protein [Occultella glacieicola]